MLSSVYIWKTRLDWRLNRMYHNLKRISRCSFIEHKIVQYYHRLRQQEHKIIKYVFYVLCCTPHHLLVLFLVKIVGIIQCNNAFIHTTETSSLFLFIVMMDVLKINCSNCLFDTTIHVLPNASHNR